MANTKSAMKRIKTNLRDRQRNRYYKSKLKTTVKAYLDAIESKSDTRHEKLKVLIRTMDKIVQKGVYHANFGARLKSKYTKLYNHSI